MWQELLNQIKQGDIKSLARAISLIENDQAGYSEILENLSVSSQKKLLASPQGFRLGKGNIG